MKSIFGTFLVLFALFTSTCLEPTEQELRTQYGMFIKRYLEYNRDPQRTMTDAETRLAYELIEKYIKMFKTNFKGFGHYDSWRIIRKLQWEVTSKVLARVAKEKKNVKFTANELKGMANVVKTGIRSRAGTIRLLASEITDIVHLPAEFDEFLENFFFLQTANADYSLKTYKAAAGALYNVKAGLHATQPAADVKKMLDLHANTTAAHRMIKMGEDPLPDVIIGTCRCVNFFNGEFKHQYREVYDLSATLLEALTLQKALDAVEKNTLPLKDFVEKFLDLFTKVITAHRDQYLPMPVLSDIEHIYMTADHDSHASLEEWSLKKKFFAHYPNFAGRLYRTMTDEEIFKADPFAVKRGKFLNREKFVHPYYRGGAKIRMPFNPKAFKELLPQLRDPKNEKMRTDYTYVEGGPDPPLTYW